MRESLSTNFHSTTPEARREERHPFKVTLPFDMGVHKIKMPTGGEWEEDEVVVDDDGGVVEGEERARLLQKRREQRRERVEGLVVSGSFPLNSFPAQRQRSDPLSPCDQRQTPSDTAPPAYLRRGHLLTPAQV